MDWYAVKPFAYSPETMTQIRQHWYEGGADGLLGELASTSLMIDLLRGSMTDKREPSTVAHQLTGRTTNPPSVPLYK